MALIRLRDIEVRIGKFRLEIESLQLPEHGLIGVLGNNGSGKSTFLNFLSGLRPYKGSYIIKERDFRSLDIRQTNQLMALLPQSVTLQLPLDVFYVVLTGRFPWTDSRTYTKEDILLTEQSLRDFDIYHLRNRSYSELSGGERQRVLLARTFNRASEVVLLDEPFNALDLKHQWETLRLLREKAKDRLVLVVLHDVEMAIREFDRFLFFKDGRLIYDLDRTTLNEALLSEVFGVNIKILEVEDERFVFVDR